MPDSKKEISVVILTYNSKNLIRDCLNSIFTYNDIGDALEVIVVDNNSQECDSMFAWIKQIYGDTIKLIKNDKNGGYGQGNNVGIRAASAPIILIMNPDVKLFKPIFRAALNNYEKDVHLGLLGMAQYENEKTRRQSYLSLSSSIFSLFLFKLYHKLNLYSPRLFCIHGSCFFIKKQALVDIGYFDENIFMYSEEIDIHIRLSNSNKYFIKYDNSLVYIHPMHNRTETVRLLRVRFMSYIYVCKKNGFNEKRIIDKQLLFYKLHLLRCRFKGCKEQYTVYSEFCSFLKLYRKKIK